MCIRDRFQQDTFFFIGGSIYKNISDVVVFRVAVMPEVLMYHVPVSYTHLDVYKRQVHARVDRRIAVGTVVIFAGNQYPEKEDEGEKDWEYRTYDKDTLDVYKRQPREYCENSFLSL